MGLKEKQWIETAKKEWVPAAEAELKERAGVAAKFETDWTTFENSLPALEKVKGQGYQSVVNALAWIGRDDAGKEAIGSIKKIVLRNVDAAAKNKVTIKTGTLTLDSAWGADAYLSENDLTAAIEAAL
jgi:hypothetical protein